MATSEETVRIRLDDGCYAVSRRKLVEQSDYFRALFRSGMREARRAHEQQLRGLSAPGLRLVLDFISSGGAWQPPADDVPLSELVEAASFLQVTSLLRLLLSRVHLHNCPELYGLAQVYGLWELRDACLRFMTVHFHEVLCQPHFHHLLASPQHPGDASLKQTLRDERMKGTPVLVALGDFLGGPLAPHPDQRDPPSMLRYDEVTDRWLPLASNLPSDLVNVRSYGSAVLDNYLFIVGGSRITSQDIAAAHSYNPSNNEWLQVASMNQKRSNFKLVAVSSKLYAIGGQAMSNVECYSPEQDAWNFVAPLPSPLAEFSACECKGKIYVIGGYTTRERNMGVLQYCPSADAWTLFGTCDVHLRKQQMLSAGDTIYAVGGCVRAGPGRGAGGEDALAVHAFDTAARRWRPLGEPARASGLGVACALHGAGVYVLSREATPTPAGARACVLLTFDLASGRWGAARRPPAAHAAPARGLLVCSLRLPAAADA